MNEYVRLVTSPYVHCRESGLEKNARRQVASLPHLTIGGDFSVTGHLAQPRPQVIHWNVHGSGNVAGSKLLRGANVQ